MSAVRATAIEAESAKASSGNLTVRRFFAFAVVGASGIVVNQLAVWFVTDVIGLHYLTSAVVATQVSTLWNFTFTEMWVFKAESPGRGWRVLWFAVLNNVWLVLRLPAMWGLTDGLGVHYLVSNVVVLAAATLIRFGISAEWIWGKARTRPSGSEVGSGTAAETGHPSSYLYDIHGIVRIASDVPLPELVAFRVERETGESDIRVVVTPSGFGGLRWRPEVASSPDGVSYVESLGRFGFGCRITYGSPNLVEVTPTVGRSPHVLYTNVLEPLLRWTLVEHGFALVHGACLEIAGRGVLITAQTDTGKTTTCILAVGRQGAGFLSDDMVLMHPSGVVLGFPKPLTISAHTLKAARSAPLRPARRLWMQVQSRVHSRGGRRAGLTLARTALPVSSMNAWLQCVVKPPKFTIHELIPDADVVRSIWVSHIAVIERGPTLVEPLDHETTAGLLAANTEDAYGFPPYPLIEDALRRDRGPEEERIRREGLARVSAMRIRTADRHWYEQLRLGALGAVVPAGVLQQGLDGRPGAVAHSSQDGRPVLQLPLDLQAAPQTPAWVLDLREYELAQAEHNGNGNGNGERHGETVDRSDGSLKEPT